MVDEYARLKRLAAELSLAKAVQNVLSKISRPTLMKAVLAYVVPSHGYSERRACLTMRNIDAILLH